VIDNVPKVGLGWPNLTPFQAFVENFLPGWNLFRIPAILRDVITRLEPMGGRGNMLIAAAWLCLFAGTVGPSVGSRVLLYLRTSIESRVTAAVIMSQLGLGLTLAGLVFLIALIRRIESGMTAAANAVEGTNRLDAALEPSL
jgi:hypothetical protein